MKGLSGRRSILKTVVWTTICAMGAVWVIGEPPDGFSLIPSGTFTMGSPESELGRWDRETQHEVTLTRAFFLQQTEVTKAQWDAVRAEGAALGYTDLPVGRNGFPDGDVNGEHPVTEVSWYDVVKWLNLKSELEGLIPCYIVGGNVYKLGQLAPDCDFDASGYRLPTESEWEYACRAGTVTAFYNGPITYTENSPLDPNLDQIGWYGGNSNLNTHIVGGKLPNAWGLYDMSGNVFEWCWDWLDETYPGTVTDPTGPGSGTFRIQRGGAWGPGYGAAYSRSAMRGGAYPDGSSGATGFRPARTGTGPEMWGPYEVTDGYCDTTPWLGVLYVELDTWVWCDAVPCWFNIPEETASDGKGWIHAPGEDDLLIAQVPGTDWGYSFALDKWMYLTASGWVYMM